MDTTPMKAIELVGDVDEQHRLQAQVPADLPAGPGHLIVLLPEEDDGGVARAHGLPKNGPTSCATRGETFTRSKMGSR